LGTISGTFCIGIQKDASGRLQTVNTKITLFTHATPLPTYHG
jgi:hypothetical protein